MSYGPVDGLTGLLGFDASFFPLEFSLGCVRVGFFGWGVGGVRVVFWGCGWSFCPLFLCGGGWLGFGGVAAGDNLTIFFWERSPFV